MFSTTVSICLALTAVALLLHRLGVWATWKHTAQPLAAAHQARTDVLEPLSILKPIKGLEEELELNLRSFFEQAYPAALQFVFTSTEPNDPGMQLARRVAADYPALRVRFATSDPSFGVNPKVSNLAGGLQLAEHDLVLQTDANVRLRPGYLQDVVREYGSSGAALLGSLIAGSGERSLGAALDNIQLTTFTTPGICLAQELVGLPCVIGKAIVYRRSELTALGGLARVKDVLAEDYVLGQAYLQAGKIVLLSRLVVDNVNVDATLLRFLGRHSRWLKMRVVVHVGGFAADLLSNATFFAVLAAALSGFEPQLVALCAAVIAYKMRVDARLIRRLRGRPLAARHLLCMPLRDLLLPCVWFYALFSRTTEWRGERFQLSRGSLLTPLTAAEPTVAELGHGGDA
jgi:ceramide glucosyltransferase